MQNTLAEKIRHNWDILGVVAAAIVVRFYNIASISLWHDEAFSALYIKYSWSEMFYRIGLDVHPPLYYILLRFWADIAGHSLFALRAFSGLFGVATVIMTYFFVKLAFENRKLAVLAALIMALNPFQIQYVTEARMYTLGSFLVMLSAYLAVRALKAQAAKKETKELLFDWLYFAIATSLAMYTHYYLFFSVLAIGLFILIYLIRTYRTNIKEYGLALGAYILVLLMYVPWLKTFAFQFGQVQENYWIPKIDKWSIPLTNWRLLGGLGENAGVAHIQVMLLLGCAFTLFLIYRIIKKEDSFYKWLVLSGLTVPFFGALALSLKQSIFLDRYFLFAGLFYSIALAIFLLSIRTKWLKYSLVGLLILITFANWMKFWQQMDIERKSGMSGASQFINRNATPEDKIFVGSSFEFFNFKYYNKSGIVPLLYTPGINGISDLPHFSGTAILTDQDLINDFKSGVSKGDTVWVLWTNAFGGSKPNVPANWQQIDEQGFEDVRPYGGTWIVVSEYIVQ